MTYLFRDIRREKSTFSVADDVQSEVMPENMRLLISSHYLERCVRNLANRISFDYATESIDDVIVVAVLKGAVPFHTRLMQSLPSEYTVDYLGVSSYNEGTETSGVVQITKDVGNIHKKNVLLVEDIVDTGLTLDHLLKHLKTKEPASLKTCTLLDKPSRRRIPLEADYTGFCIDNHFVVGFGLDDAGRYRGLPYVGFFPEK